MEQRHSAPAGADLEALPSSISFDSPKGRCLKQLCTALDRLEAGDPLPDRLDALERLARWVCEGPKPPDMGAESAKESPKTLRARLFIWALRVMPRWRAGFVAVTANVLAETSSLRLFCEVGLPNPRGLGPETADRLARRLLPVPVDHGDLADLVSRMLRTEKEASWIEALDSRIVNELGSIVGAGWEPVQEAMHDAIALLATRVSALGMAEDIRVRSPEGPVRESPFFQLATAPLDQILPLVEAAREKIERVNERLETHGVSVDVVYRLDVMSRALDRLEVLLPLVLPSASERDRARSARDLMASLTRARVGDRSLASVLTSSTRMLALKVIDHAGDTGEHYITATRREYWKMLASAGGGGFLTAGTVAIKFLTKWGHFAPFVDGFLSSTNYAASFVLMQLLGFTLATKQPSMTAAALAASIKGVRGPDGTHKLGELVTMIARICRSQLAAAAGNIGIVVPTALAFHALYASLTGSPFLDEDTARSVVASFHPTESGTLVFAALTGCLLWASSLAAGWLENWAIYRRLPEAIADHRIGRFVGARTMAWLSRFFSHHVSGFGGNVALGVLLGMTPALGAFFGLPLDVRHVTLSSGSLTLAMCTLGTESLSHAAFWWAAGGIACIGALNFGVSFALALAVALRAKDVGWRERFTLLGAVAGRFMRSPGEFLLPP